MKLLVIMFVVSLGMCASGCRTITGAIAPRASEAIKAYCLEPLSTRQIVRAQVADLIKPNKILIFCEGDLETLPEKVF